ncbi:MAG TPA: hypothetical protein VFB76_01235 [Candidatus Angelobacter sp.]|nr:hypothetical protein [Candidatus Angelobacter sp.]
MARKLVPTYVVGGVTDDFGYRRGENAAGMIEEESKAWYKARTPEEKAEIERQRDERRLREAKEREKQAWPATRAGQLLKQLGECFEAYRQCVMEDPRLQEKALEFDEVNQKIFNKMKSTIDRANGAPRCQYPKGNGVTCRAPRVRGKKFCHMHLMLEEARPEKISLPNLADARGIHGAIAKGAQAVVDGKLDYKQASIFGYYLQLALSNVKRVELEENPTAD